MFFIVLIAVKQPTLNITTKHLNNDISLKAKPVKTVMPIVRTAAKVEPVAVKVTTPTVPVAAAPVSYPIVCGAYLTDVEQYDWNVETAMAIMQAESGCNPYAISNASINFDGLPDYGLFQLHDMDILNPEANIAAAYQKYLSQGWAAWSTYNSGVYKQYL